MTTRFSSSSGSSTAAAVARSTGPCQRGARTRLSRSRGGSGGGRRSPEAGLGSGGVSGRGVGTSCVIESSVSGDRPRSHATRNLSQAHIDASSTIDVRYLHDLRPMLDEKLPQDRSVAAAFVLTVAADREIGRVREHGQERQVMLGRGRGHSARSFLVNSAHCAGALASWPRFTVSRLGARFGNHTSYQFASRTPFSAPHAEDAEPCRFWCPLRAGAGFRGEQLAHGRLEDMLSGRGRQINGDRRHFDERVVEAAAAAPVGRLLRA